MYPVLEQGEKIKFHLASFLQIAIWYGSLYGIRKALRKRTGDIMRWTKSSLEKLPGAERIYTKRLKKELFNLAKTQKKRVLSSQWNLFKRKLILRFVDDAGLTGLSLLHLKSKGGFIMDNKKESSKKSTDEWNGKIEVISRVSINTLKIWPWLLLPGSWGLALVHWTRTG